MVDGRGHNQHSQIDWFQQAVRDLGCDDDPDRFKATRKVMKHKPVEKPE